MEKGPQQMNKIVRFYLVVLCVLFSNGILAEDPFVKVNQITHQVNETADRYFLKPVANGYVKVTPKFVRRGVVNFFGNLNDVGSSVNNVLQGKPKAGLSDLARILINTTLGIAGLFDPASKMGLVKHEESFGQTLSVWGVPAGPYVVLPFLGPSTLTDAIANTVDTALDPIRYLYPVDHRNRTYAMEALEQRANLLAADKVVFGNRYVFLREAYLQRREYLVKDGVVEDEFDDF